MRIDGGKGRQTHWYTLRNWGGASERIRGEQDRVIDRESREGRGGRGNGSIFCPYEWPLLPR